MINVKKKVKENLPSTAIVGKTELRHCETLSVMSVVCPHKIHSRPCRQIWSIRWSLDLDCPYLRDARTTLVVPIDQALHNAKFIHFTSPPS